VPPTGPDASPLASRGISSGLVALMAVATGAIVANLYYSQPLLHLVSKDLHIGTTAASSIVTITQVGYAAGLLLVVPLGDLHPRRTLAVLMFLAAAVSLVACAVAPDFAVFLVGSLAVGCASVGGQIMIPFAADLAPDERRGRIVARIMTGLLIGILLARTFAGIVAQLAGWRAIYAISAGLMVVFAVVLRRALPGEPQRPRRAYGALVLSSLRLLVDQPMLRRRAGHGACAFAGFSVLWTSLAFLLSGAPYHYSSALIGLFGLVGAAGVLAANLAGKLADAQRVTVSTVAAGVLLTGSFGLMAWGATSLGALLAGIVVLDVGTQGMQITNQAIIYTLVPEARSRINSAYMTCYFVGGAVGSLSAGAVFAAAGWDGVCVLGASFGAASLALSLFDRLRPAGDPRPADRRTEPAVD
jgi:predicted MFS family arabinose efflux permease